MNVIGMQILLSLMLALILLASAVPELRYPIAVTFAVDLEWDIATQP